MLACSKVHFHSSSMEPWKWSSPCFWYLHSPCDLLVVSHLCHLFGSLIWARIMDLERSIQVQPGQSGLNRGFRGAYGNNCSTFLPYL